MDVSDARRLKHLEAENIKLKKALAESDHHAAALRYPFAGGRLPERSLIWRSAALLQALWLAAVQWACRRRKFRVTAR